MDEEPCNETVAVLNDTLNALQSAFDECGCGADPCASEVAPNENLGLHIGAVFIIFFASLLGVTSPLVARRMNLAQYPIVLLKHFGTGIILACALIHMLQPANGSLSSACLGTAFTEDYAAYAYLFALISIMIMHGSERGFRHYLITKHNGGIINAEANVVDTKEAGIPPSGAALTHHVHSDPVLEASTTEVRLQAYMLEFGFTAHSVFIGLAVGIEQEDLAPLVIALTFHQLFEGLGLGARLSEDGMKLRDSILLGLIFAVSAPIGIMVGTIITSQLEPGGPAFLLTQGILDSICAGILLYVGFILLFFDFPRDCKHILTDVDDYPRLKTFGLYCTMWSGAGLMAFIGRFL
jgi:zinc transporter 1/2/3